MSEETFETRLIKLIAAQLYFSVSLQASREMFGKSYFSLGVAEKAAVDQIVMGHVGANFQQITPELLKNPTGQATVGFQSPSQASPSVPNASEKKP